MFEIKYKLTDSDMKSVNKSIMWMYFVPYLVVALLGLGAGIAATIIRSRTEILVLGIILIVLGAILLGCTIMLAIAPKNFVASVIMPDDETERNVKVGDDGITIETEGQSDISIAFAEIAKVKNKKSYLVVYVGKEQILMIKDAVVSGGSLNDVYEFIKSKLVPVAPAPAASADNAESVAEEHAEEPAHEQPVAEEHAEEPAHEEPVAEEHAEEPAHEEPVAEEHAEESAAEEPAHDETAAATDEAAAEKAEEKPDEKKPAAKKSTAKSSSAKSSSAKSNGAKASSAAKSGSAKSSTAKPSSAKSGSAKASAAKKSGGAKKSE